MMEVSPDTIHKYLSNQLEDSEREEFEVVLLSSEALQREVTLEKQLRIGLLEARGKLLSPAPRAWLIQPRELLISKIWSYAATVIAIVSLSGLVVYELLPGNKAQPELGTLADVRLLEAFGPESQDREIIKIGTSGALLSIDIGAHARHPYSVRISSRQGFELERSALRANERNFLNIVVPGLDKGSYSLVVQGPSVSDRFLLEVQ